MFNCYVLYYKLYSKLYKSSCLPFFLFTAELLMGLTDTFTGREKGFDE